MFYFISNVATIMTILKLTVICHWAIKNNMMRSSDTFCRYYMCPRQVAKLALLYLWVRYFRWLRQGFVFDEFLSFFFLTCYGQFSPNFGPMDHLPLMSHDKSHVGSKSQIYDFHEQSFNSPKIQDIFIKYGDIDCHDILHKRFWVTKCMGSYGITGVDKF